MVLCQRGSVLAQLMAKHSFCTWAGLPFSQGALTALFETSFRRNQNIPCKKPPPLLRVQGEEFHPDSPPVQPELHPSAQQVIDDNCPDTGAEQEPLEAHTEAAAAAVLPRPHCREAQGGNLTAIPAGGSHTHIQC